MSTRAVSSSAALTSDPARTEPLDPQRAALVAPGLATPGAAASSSGAATGASGIRRVAPAATPALADPVTLAGLPGGVADARAATLAGGREPAEPRSWASLCARVTAALPGLPEAYRKDVAEPLLHALQELGPDGYAELLAADPDRTGGASILLDVAQAVLQHDQGPLAKPTRAFQEVVSDVYGGFLANGASHGISPPGGKLLAPMVRWGGAADGPYTWTTEDTGKLGVGTAVVSLPPAMASRGLFAWAALAHEAAGHDLLAADPRLRRELAGKVREALLAERMDPALADYWASRIDETGSDVLGVLNMGPAAAVGTLGYIRGVRGVYTGRPVLSSIGDAADPHPADVARAYVMAEAVRLLEFEEAGRWATALDAQASADAASVIRLGKVLVTPGVARDSAAIVARTIVQAKLERLGGHAFGEVQNWSDRDEAVVAQLRRRAAGGAELGTEYLDGAYAAHAVSAAIYDVSSGAASPAEAQRQLIDVLDQMNRRNPVWAGPELSRTGT